MNKVYKVKWHQLSQSFVVTSELSTNHGKKSQSSRAKRPVLLTLTVSIGLIVLCLPAYGAISGGTNHGAGSVVRGNQGTAIGNNASAASQAIALGADSKANGPASIAIGGDDIMVIPKDIRLKFKEIMGVVLDDSYRSTQAIGAATVAIGMTAVAEGPLSMAIGTSSKSSGFGSLSVGVNSRASGSRSIAIGSGASSEQEDALTLGSGSAVTALRGLALGTKATVSVVDGVAIGTNSIADRKADRDPYVISNATEEDLARIKATIGTGGAVSIGNENKKRQLIRVAAGAADDDAVNIAQLRAVESLAMKAIDGSSINIKGNIGQANVRLEDTVLIKGESEYAAETFSGKNLATHVDDKGAVNIALARDLSDIDSLSMKDADGNNSRLTAKDGLSLQGADGRSAEYGLNGSSVTGPKGTTTMGENGLTVKGADGDVAEMTYGKDGIKGKDGEGKDGEGKDIDLAVADLLSYEKGKDAVALRGENGTVISNVAAGVDDKDAVNVSQLNAATAATAGVSDEVNKGLNISGNVGSGNLKLGDTLTIKGAGAYTAEAFSGTNLATYVDDKGAVNVALARDLSDIDSVSMKDAEGNSSRLTAKDGLSLQGVDGQSAQYGLNGSSVTGQNGTATLGEHGLTVKGKDGELGEMTYSKDGIKGKDSQGKDIDLAVADLVSYEKGKDALVLRGENGTVISNVADGQLDHDAATVGQLNVLSQANTNTLHTANAAYKTSMTNSKRIDGLAKALNDTNSKMDRGMAASAALTGLFQPYNVGKFNMTAAVGGYKSRKAIAIGTGYRVSDKVAFKAGFAFSGRGEHDVMYNAGVNIEW